ncbi:MAG: Type 1 glutamine amidotransferase-like domain-containing protein [Ruminococcus sp.]|uniref:Type 1 glutamine amidotransferase-like domain-containing protein n=1 Tax=Ruminococcus sp. TaxID=41978 RepID=UPI0025EBDD29|nr:Type 1 glutamine amidotransferase-like domain-containing protein [Ruminococcus sp.]MBR0529405.1 Type 1 glutamine amidotransferase-like domain-containing protein [Ruminococcus sp.]
MIILGSNGFENPTVCKKLDKLFPDKTGKLLFINIARWDSMEVGLFEKACAAGIGFKEENITIFDENDPDAVKGMKFDHIAVTGGNTFRLLHLMKKFGLDSLVKEHLSEGADYMGFSAGAYMVCKEIGYVDMFDDNIDITDGDFTAIGWIEQYPICHFERKGSECLVICKNRIGGSPEMLTIDELELKILKTNDSKKFISV